jgi:hypothetical protein
MRACLLECVRRLRAPTRGGIRCTSNQIDEKSKLLNVFFKEFDKSRIAGVTRELAAGARRRGVDFSIHGLRTRARL